MIKKWFTSRCIKRVPKNHYPLAQKTTLRHIVQRIFSDRINALAIELSGGARPGHRDWLGPYSTAIKQVMETLSEEDVELAQTELEKELKSGLPWPERQRYVLK